MDLPAVGLLQLSKLSVCARVYVCVCVKIPQCERKGEGWSEARVREREREMTLTKEIFYVSHTNFNVSK
jgi:hypothetical protein